MGSPESKPAAEEPATPTPSSPSTDPDSFASFGTTATFEAGTFGEAGGIRALVEPATIASPPRTTPRFHRSPRAWRSRRQRSDQGEVLSPERPSIDARLKAVAAAQAAVRRAVLMTDACRRGRLFKAWPSLEPTPDKKECLAGLTHGLLHLPGGCFPAASRSHVKTNTAGGPAAPPAGAVVAAPEPVVLPSCAYRAGVTESEREEFRNVARRYPSGLAPHTTRPHDGYLELGCARILAHDRASASDEVRAAEHERQLRGFGEALAWRRQAGADAVLENGLPSVLMDGAQSESWEYGQTRAGLPIFVDRAETWLSAIRAARQQGLSPQQYGAQRVYWHERCLEVTAQHHAAGVGNGQYVLGRAARTCPALNQQTTLLGSAAPAPFGLRSTRPVWPTPTNESCREPESAAYHPIPAFSHTHRLWARATPPPMIGPSPLSPFACPDPHRGLRGGGRRRGRAS